MAKDPYAKPSMEAVAHHEAAHAVAHVKLRLPGELLWIMVDDERPRSGQAKIERPPGIAPSADQALDCIVQCLVGVPAEAAIDHEWAAAKAEASDEDRGDYKDAKNFAKYFNLDENWSAWEAAAKAFVDQHWSQIHTVAEGLLAKPLTDGKKTLPGDRVRDLLGR